jgi:hypothetical protein
MHKLKKFIPLSMALLTAATMNRLPVVVRAGSEFEEVGRKPLGDGFTGVPVREFHLSRVRSFRDGQIGLAMNSVITRGYGGQTVETLHAAENLAPGLRGRDPPFPT